MDTYLQEFFKVLLTMGLGGVVHWIHSTWKSASDDRVKETNLSRDMSHLKNTQAQHGLTIADLDSKLDRILEIVSTQSTRIAVLEERGRPRSSSFIKN